YFDIHKSQWSSELLERAGADTDLPALLKGNGAPLAPVRAEVLAETGLAGKPVVAVGGHDHVVGSLAAGATTPGMLINSLGTAEGLFLATAAPISDPDLPRQGYVQGAVVTHRKTFFAYAGINSCGGALDWCRHLVGNPAREAIIAEAGA